MESTHVSAREASDALKLVRVLHSLRDEPRIASEVLVQWLGRTLKADRVHVGRRKADGLPGPVHWTTASCFVEGGFDLEQFNEQMMADQDFCLAKAAEFLARPCHAGVECVASSALEPIPLAGRTLRLYAEYVNTLQIADSIMCRSAALGQPGFVGWLCTARRVGKPQQAEREFQITSFIARSIDDWFWPEVALMLPPPVAAPGWRPRSNAALSGDTLGSR